MPAAPFHGRRFNRKPMECKPPGHLRGGVEYPCIHEPTRFVEENMIDQLFNDVALRERLLAGPMGSYLDVLASRLLQLRYSHSQSRFAIAVPFETPTDAFGRARSRSRARS